MKPLIPLLLLLMFWPASASAQTCAHTASVQASENRLSQLSSAMPAPVVAGFRDMFTAVKSAVCSNSFTIPGKRNSLEAMYTVFGRFYFHFTLPSPDRSIFKTIAEDLSKVAVTLTRQAALPIDSAYTQNVVPAAAGSCSVTIGVPSQRGTLIPLIGVVQVPRGGLQILQAIGTPSGGTYTWSNSPESVIDFRYSEQNVLTYQPANLGSYRVSVVYTAPNSARCKETKTVHHVW